MLKKNYFLQNIYTLKKNFFNKNVIKSLNNKLFLTQSPNDCKGNT